MRKPSQSVSFRLSQDILDALDKRCKETRLSRGELSRVLVIAGLIAPQSDEIYSHLQCIENRLLSALEPLSKQPKVLSYLLNALLVTTGKVTREQAVEIVRNEFLNKIGGGE